MKGCVVPNEAMTKTRRCYQSLAMVCDVTDEVMGCVILDEVMGCVILDEVMGCVVSNKLIAKIVDIISVW